MPFVPRLRLAPVRARHEACAAEHVLERGIDLLVEDDAARISEQQRIAGAGDLIVQPIDLGRARSHEVCVLLAPIRERARIDDVRRIRPRRIEPVVVGTAHPRARDRAVGQLPPRARKTVNDAHDVVGMPRP